jgi:hemin uptake protein HemP
MSTAPHRTILSTRHAGHAPSNQPTLPVVSTGSLFGNRRELLIEHGGAQYRLRITQNNKLILTK